MNSEDTLYADYELDGGTDMFVITPEGNYFNFPFNEYNETHEPIIIIDTKSHKRYKVIFGE
jgi:hypothetical protein